jgi:peptide-methionine (S)-S-oxide reductase
VNDAKNEGPPENRPSDEEDIRRVVSGFPAEDRDRESGTLIVEMEDRTMSRLFTRNLVGFLGLFAVFGLTACDYATSSAELPKPAVDASRAQANGPQTAVLAGGCFWGLEGVFQHTKGVLDVTSGYSGGSANTATYHTVSTGKTGHAESVRITYDPSKISYGQLLRVYFSVAHDPTELNRQGPDVGTQYRSEIFYANDEQRNIAKAYIDQLQRAKVFSRPIVTKVGALDAFYPAEDYHQDYLAHHPNQPYIVINDLPKIDHLRKQFPDLYVEGK